jgi:hypothetical protein
MSYLGTWQIDDVMTFPAITHRFDTGTLTDADAVPAYRVYEDETGTAILTGNMAKLDDANTTGFYSEQLTLSAANGFEVGKSYSIYITAVVNSVTGGQHHTFQVEAAVATASALATAQTSIDDLPTNAELATALGTADDAVLTAINDLPTNAELATALGTADDAVLTAVAGVLTAIGDLPTNAELATALGTADDAVLAAIAALAVSIAALPSESENATELLDQANGVETGLTVRQALRVALAALAGKSSGSSSERVYRDVNDTKNRITATVSAGDRTAVTLNST